MEKWQYGFLRSAILFLVGESWTETVPPKRSLLYPDMWAWVIDTTQGRRILGHSSNGKRSPDYDYRDLPILSEYGALDAVGLEGWIASQTAQDGRYFLRRPI